MWRCGWHRGRGQVASALAWIASPRAPVGPGEVEITIAAVGLNFRDVMWNLGLLPEEALEDGYAGAQLGMECAGTISVVGPEVEGLAVGDQVVAFVSGGFASHVVAPAFAVSPLPAGLTLEAAATLPVAFLTAYYSLVHLAHLKRGETVLVHGGAGAVGLAALQIARHVRGTPHRDRGQRGKAGPPARPRSRCGAELAYARFRRRGCGRDTGSGRRRGAELAGGRGDDQIDGLPAPVRPLRRTRQTRLLRQHPSRPAAVPAQPLLFRRRHRSVDRRTP